MSECGPHLRHTANILLLFSWVLKAYLIISWNWVTDNRQNQISSLWLSRLLWKLIPISHITRGRRQHDKFPFIKTCAYDKRSHRWKISNIFFDYDFSSKYLFKITLFFPRCVLLTHQTAFRKFVYCKFFLPQRFISAQFVFFSYF